MQVRELMTERVISVGQDEPVTAAARLLKRHNIGALPVCDSSGRLRGLVTDRDIVLRCVAMGEDPQTTRTGEIMSRGILTAEPDDSVDRAVRVMAQDQVRRLPVLDNGRLVGMVSLCDMARNRDCDMEAAEALTEISANIKRR
ncbi:MAG: CBS domain-containing protein [Eubacteriales bacterium]|nr:CBS domain-containing protein [Eubacteriales bacterium]